MNNPESDRRWFETRWSGRLRNLGFTRDQIIRGQSTSDARILIPGTIRGEPVQFAFGTNCSWRCQVYQSYVEDRGLPVFQTAEGRDRVRVGEIGAFGKTWDEQSTTVLPISWRGFFPPIAGRIGSRLLQDSVVAVDASVPAIAHMPAASRPTLAGALCRLPLIPKAWRGMCYTASVSGAVFAIAYEWPTSVTKAYLAGRRLRAGSHGRADVALHLPGDITVMPEAGVLDEVNAEPLADAGITRVDGYLGADLWCRWITVFDFPAGELLLFSYD